MSENTKPRFDPLPGLGPRSDSHTVTPASTEPPAAADDAESAMRRALGLLGETRPRPEAERTEPPPRAPERFGGGLHRRRFVQDGDVQVTVLRRDPATEASPHRAASAAPTSSRLQRAEAALATETAARAQAERALADAQAAVRDLQTKIGHADLAKNEAVDALRREREEIAGLRHELDTLRAELAEARQRTAEAERQAAEFEDLVAEERQARRDLEKALKAAEAARDAAERLVRTLSEEADDDTAFSPPPRARTSERPVAEPKRRGRPARVMQPVLPELEPEPVKWWLTPAKPAGRRR